MTNNTSSNDFYTAYLVRDVRARKYLNQKIYTGRRPGIWGRMTEAHIFFNKRQAESCACDINRRRPSQYSAYFAEVVPVKFKKNATA